MTLTINLDSIEKWKSKQEYTTMQRASCTYNGQYYEYVSNGALVKPLLQAVAKQNGPISGLVEVLRGDTTCFHLAPIESWLFPPKKYANEGLRKYQEERG